MALRRGCWRPRRVPRPNFSKTSYAEAMPDVFDTRKRSEVMSAIRGRGNKSTEVAFIAAMRRAGVKGWRRHLCFRLELTYDFSDDGIVGPKVALVRPDFTFRAERL